MVEEIVKDLFRAKLKMMNAVIAVMPPEIKERAAHMQRSVLKAVNEVAREYAGDKAPCTPPKGGKELKTINID